MKEDKPYRHRIKEAYRQMSPLLKYSQTGSSIMDGHQCLITDVIPVHDNKFWLNEHAMEKYSKHQIHQVKITDSPIVVEAAILDELLEYLPIEEWMCDGKNYIDYVENRLKVLKS